MGGRGLLSTETMSIKENHRLEQYLHTMRAPLVQCAQRQNINLMSGELAQQIGSAPSNKLEASTSVTTANESGERSYMGDSLL